MQIGWQPGSRQSYCKNKQAYFFGPPCISLHHVHAAIVIISRPQLDLLVIYKVILVRYDSIKIIFMKFRQKLTIITTKIIGQLFGTSEHE